jgi:acyl-coenzyme A thioesterase PaaI-like protein
VALDAALRGPVIDGPDAEGFYGVSFPGDGHNAGYGRMLARAEGPDTARVRIETGARAANVLDAVHGGFLLSFLDQALFVGPVTLERIAFGGAVTLGVSTQFLAPGAIDRPLDCMVEIVRETGRLLFLRGEMEQDGTILLTYQATVRKLGGKAG